MKSKKQIKEYLKLLEAKLNKQIAEKEATPKDTAKYHVLLNEIIETQKQLEILRWVLR